MASEVLSVRLLLVCRCAVVIATVVAVVLGEPESLLEEVVTVPEEGLNLLPGESLSSRVKREYTNNRAARRRVFRQTDLNGNGLVTRKEYVMRNGNMTEEELDILFGAFDVDGDRSLSQDEFVRHGFLWEMAQECELDSIQRCDDEFIYLIRATDPGNNADNQQGMLCRALQTYFDCIEHEQVTCDITSYSQAVMDLVATYRTVHFCPDLNFAGLLSMPNQDDLDVVDDEGLDDDETMMEPSELLSSDQEQETNEDNFDGYRRRRAAPSGSEQAGFPFSLWGGTVTQDSGTESCTTSVLASCTASFNDELRRPSANFCTSLSDYRHCVTRHTRRCREFELLEVEDSLKKWLHLHHKLEMC